MATKKLTRSANKMLAGVCGGIAEYFDIDPTLVRVLYAALSLFSAAFPGLILYIIMMLIMPEKDKNDKYEDAQVVE
jgi:phage shock protein C